jgi:predicted  nucleic acid-binding Zn-ribbon protein
MAIRCTCGHLWLTTSKSMYPTCPRCHTTVSRKKHAVILESDTKRKLKEKAADSRSHPQNPANSDGIGELRREYVHLCTYGQLLTIFPASLSRPLVLPGLVVDSAESLTLSFQTSCSYPHA